MTALPLDLDADTGQRPSWDRLPDEPSRAFAAFRLWRNLPPTQRRTATVAEQAKVNPRTARQWAADWDWRSRADDWDEACHRVEDAERLEALRSMHQAHRQAGRAALDLATRALGLIDADQLTPAHVARLMELGAKLERSTLIVSVEELQGLADIDDDEDPWERIARELAGTDDADG